MSGAKTILIVDDQPIMRLGLANLVDGEPELEVIGEAANTADG